MTSALLLVCRLTGCLTGCVWRGTRSIHLHYQRHWTVLPTINELPQRSDLSKQEIRLNFYCYCTLFLSSWERRRKGRSARILPDGVRQGPVARSLVSANLWLRGIKMYRFPWYLTLVSTNHASSNPGQEISRFARWHTTLYNMVNISVEMLL